MRVLIVCTFSNPDRMRSQRLASKLLLWGLDEAGLEWELYRPWTEPPRIDRFDAVLCWPFRHQRHNFLFHAKRFERVCREAGVPVVNSLQSYSNRHSDWLQAWPKFGVVCPHFARFRQFAATGVEFPMILRVDGLHRGRQMHLTQTVDEARDVVARARASWLAGGSDAVLPLDLAVEFIDTRFADGFYRKRRVFVVGDEVIARQQLVSRHWLVNFDSMETTPSASAENRQFLADGEPDHAPLIRAARACTADLVALDYVRTAEGQLVFWEGNRRFSMAGDGNYANTAFQDAAGLSQREHAAIDRQLGRALARLVLRRACE